MFTKKSQPTPTPDEIWAILKANAEQMKETDREIREIAKLQKETKRELKKAQNLFTTQWGKLMESLVEGDLVDILNNRDIEVKRTSKSHKGQMSYTDEHGKEQEMLCEIDIIAEDGEKIVVVEVKTTLRVRDVDKFLGILQKFHQLFPKYRGNKVYGAVAYLQSQECSEDYAESQGLFVIRATGSSSSIINKKAFQAKAFG